MSVLTSVPPVSTAAAWRGDRLTEKGGWIYELSTTEIDKLEALGTRYLDEDPDLRVVKAEDYPLDSVREAVDQWRAQSPERAGGVG